MWWSGPRGGSVEHHPVGPESSNQGVGGQVHPHKRPPDLRKGRDEASRRVRYGHDHICAESERHHQGRVDHQEPRSLHIETHEQSINILFSLRYMYIWNEKNEHPQGYKSELCSS